jgi:hypothetical protein
MHTDLLVLLGRLPPGKVEALEERPHHLLEQPRARHPAVDVVLRDPRRDLQAVHGGQVFLFSCYGSCMLVPGRVIEYPVEVLEHREGHGRVLLWLLGWGQVREGHVAHGVAGCCRCALLAFWFYGQIFPEIEHEKKRDGHVTSQDFIACPPAQTRKIPGYFQ